MITRGGCAYGTTAHLRIKLMFALLLLPACESQHSAPTPAPAPTEPRREAPAEALFCYLNPPKSSPGLRECAAKPLTACTREPDKCFRQGHAFCFYRTGFGEQWICLVTKEECEQWRHLEKDEGGPCLRMEARDAVFEKARSRQ
jgi:hypothetical protein